VPVLPVLLTVARLVRHALGARPPTRPWTAARVPSSAFARAPVEHCPHRLLL